MSLVDFPISFSHTITTSTFKSSLVIMEEDLAASLGMWLQLTVNEERTIEIPDGVWDTSATDMNLCLVGRFLSHKQIHIESFE